MFAWVEQHLVIFVAAGLIGLSVLGVKIENENAQIKATATIAKQVAAEVRNVTVASAKARVTTVTQRCDLTKILYDKSRVHYPTERAQWEPYQLSYDECAVQLKEVKLLYIASKKV